MAMRPRGGGATAPKRSTRTAGVRPVYEDFRPMSEWQEDDEFHFLNINLPGFAKEQIRVSTEGRNTIRVRGERLVADNNADNKWNRFQEDFEVPENGEMSSIRAKYQGPVLTITVPKKEKPQEVIPPTPKDVDTQKQPTLEKGKDSVTPEVATSQSTKEKTNEPQKTSGDLRTEHAQDAERKKSSELKDNHIASEKPDMTKTTLDKPWKNSEDNKELPYIEPAKKTKLVKDGAAGTSEKNAEENKPNGKQTIHPSGADYGTFTLGKYVKALKRLTELNEERQLVANMGVAVLVIMALSAYVTYKFASGKDEN